MKTVLFCRVSSKEQEDEGYSLPSQEKLLKAYAEKHSFEIIKVFSISETGSKSDQRKTFKEMLEFLKKNNIKVLVCEKTDRLLRNKKDAVKIDEWMNENSEHSVHFVKESSVLHKDSKSHEKFIWNIRVSVAQFYTDNLSEDVKKGQVEKIAQGWLPTKPPYGYKTIGEKGRKTHIIDEDVAPLIDKMFKLYDSGEYSVVRLSNKMNEIGLKTVYGNSVSKSRIHELLKDVFYIGKNKWNDNIYQGEHEPLIDKDLFERVQRRLKSRTTPRYQKHFHLFTGLMKCFECGGIVSWEIHKGIVYGHCNHYKQCSQRVWAKEDDVDGQIAAVLDRLNIKNKRITDWIRKALLEHHKKHIEYRISSVEQINKLVSQIHTKLDNLYDDKVSGQITKEFYDRKFNKYSDELKLAEEQLDKQSKDNNQYYQLGINYFDLAQKGSLNYTKAKKDPKRLLLKLVFKEMKINKGVLSFKLTRAFELLSEIAKVANSSKVVVKVKKPEKSFELIRKTDTASQMEQFYTLHPALLLRQGSNLRPCP